MRDRTIKKLLVYFIQHSIPLTDELSNILDLAHRESHILIGRVITPQQRYEVLKRQTWKCNICTTQLKYKKTSPWEGETAHIDHIHPYSKRDSYPNGKENINELENLQALCPKCNLSKNKKEIN